MNKIKVMPIVIAACLAVCCGGLLYDYNVRESARITQERQDAAENEENVVTGSQEENGTGDSGFSEDGNASTGANVAPSGSATAVWSDVTFEGQKEVDDTPWGFNAGVIDVDGDSCILLTPNTAVTLPNVVGEKKVSFDYQLHPWVKENSDGAGLLVRVLDEKGNILFEDSLQVDKDAAWSQYEVSLEEYPEAVSVKVYCNNGENGDDSADWVILRGRQEKDIAKTGFGSDGYVKSATYFADEWPINFWNSEMDSLDADMEQIKNDGFNSIILVIPWREFQPAIEPVTYNEAAFSKLDEVMKAAGQADLDVYTRIGYTWDFYEDAEDSIVDHFCQLLGNAKTQEAWYDYVRQMFSTLCKYSNFKGGFITWEDFWNTLGICDEVSEEARKEKAAFVGYQEYVKNNYSLDDYNNKYGTSYASYDDIPVPMRTEPAMEVMYQFYDAFLNSLLAKSQKYFPDLSMEVRMDWDVVYNTDGSTGYYTHTSTYACENAGYTATMYGIPMGFENKGEKVSYTEAMEKTEYILQELKKQNEQKPVYIEQFIFADNTPDFKNNAQIKENEMNLYLENVAEILLDNSEGYGIWTYRNYRGNMIYNSQFALDGEGWETSGDVSFAEKEGSIVCSMQPGEMIAQEICEERNHFDSDEYTLSLDVVNVDKQGNLILTVGSYNQKIPVNKSGEIKIKVPKNDSFNLSIEADDCEVDIDNIRLYSQVQEGYLYDEDNNELQCVEGIRTLNGKLNR